MRYEGVSSFSSALIGDTRQAVVAEDGKGGVFEVLNPTLKAKNRKGHLVDMPLVGQGCPKNLMPVEYTETCFMLRHGDGKFVGVGMIRPGIVEVTGLNRQGEPIQQLLRGVVSVAVQHEVDHLNGFSLKDRMGPLRRKALEKGLRQL
jgi:hypothetical protein